MMKAFLRGKLIALSASKKKLERAYTSSLTAHLKALEQKETNSPKSTGPEFNSQKPNGGSQPSIMGSDFIF